MLAAVLVAASIAVPAVVHFDTCHAERAVPEHWEINTFGQQTLIRPTPPAVTVRFVDIASRVVRSVRFAVTEGTIAVAELTTRGTFSPAIAITQSFVLPDATILIEPVRCIALAVTEDDGSVWTNAAPPRPLEKDATR